MCSPQAGSSTCTGVCLHPQTETWHFNVGCLRFASSVHQGIEPCELGQRLTVHVLKIGAVLKRLGCLFAILWLSLEDIGCSGLVKICLAVSRDGLVSKEVC